MSDMAESSENVRVYVRVRPASSREKDMGFQSCVQVQPDGKSLAINTRPEPRSFHYDHVADVDSTQDEVFQKVGKPITDTCMSGYNGTIFAYGQTGSGKTFTVQGPHNADEKSSIRGLMPRVFDYLCGQMARETRKSGGRITYVCKCSFLEIYNDHIYDLLDPHSMSLHIHEDKRKGVFVANLTEETVENAADCLRVMGKGIENRTVGETAMNRESSRSHSVFSLYIQSTETKDGVTNERYSRFNLVDLAGSERQKATAATGIRLVEAGSINRSLSALGNVIMALVDIARGKQRHVHYRDSKLTFLLKDSLGGNSLTYLVACISPAAESFGETLSTLKFAQRAKFIRNRAKINQDQTSTVRGLQAENSQLKEQIRQLQSLAQASNRRKSLAFTTPHKSRLLLGDPDSTMLSSDSGIVPQQYQAMLDHAVDRERDVRAENDSLRERIALMQDLIAQQEKKSLSANLVLTFRQRTIDALQRQIKATSGEDQTQALQEQLRQMQDEKQQLEEQLKYQPELLQKTLEVLQLEERIHELESLMVTQEMVEVSDSKANPRQKLAQVQAFNFELTTQIQALTSQHTTLSGEIAELRATLSSPNKLLHAMSTPKRREFESFELEKWKREQNFDKKLQQINETFSAERDQLQKQLTKVSKDAELLGDRNSIVESMLKQREDEMEAARLQAEAAERRTTQETEAKISDLRSRNEQRVTLLKDSHAQEMSHLKVLYEQQVDTLRKGEQQSEAMSSEMKIELAEICAAHERLQHDFDAGMHERIEMQQDHQRQHAKLQSRLQEQQAKAQQQKEVFEHQLAEATEKSAQHSLRADAAVHQLEEANGKLTEQTKQTQYLQDELATERKTSSELGSENEALKSKLASIQNDNQNLQASVASMEQVLDRKESDINELEINSELLQEEFDTNMEKLTFLEEAHEQKQRELLVARESIQEHQTHADELQHQVANLKESLNTVRQQFQDTIESKLSNQAQSVEKERQVLQGRVEQLQDSLSQSLRTEQKLVQQISELEQDAEQRDTDLAKAHDSVEMLKKAMQSQQQHVAAQAQKLDNATREQQDISEKFDDSRKEVEQLQRQLHEQVVQIDELQREVEEAELARREEVRTIMAELSDYKSKFDATASQCRTLHDESKDLTQSLEAAESERDSLHSSLKALEEASQASLNNSNALNAELTAKVEHLTEQLTKSHQLTQDQQRRLVSFDSMVQKLNSAVQSTSLDDEQNSDTESSSCDDAAEVGAIVQNRYIALQHRLQEAQMALEESVAEAKCLRTEKRKVSDQCNQLNAKVKQLSADLHSTEDRFSSLISNMKERSSSQETQLSAQQKQLASTHEELQSALQSLSSTQAECDNLEQQLQQLQAMHTQRCAALEAQIDQFQNSNYEARKEMENTASHEASMAAEIASLREQLVTLQHTKSEWLDEMRRIRDEEERTFEEKQQLETEVERLRDAEHSWSGTLTTLEQENAKLTAQNTKLIGHQNPKQKIQLHMKIKKENDQLKQEKLALERELRRFRRHLRTHLGSSNQQHLLQGMDDSASGDDEEDTLRAKLEAVAMEKSRIANDVSQLQDTIDELVPKVLPSFEVASMKGSALSKLRHHDSNARTSLDSQSGSTTKPHRSLDRKEQDAQGIARCIAFIQQLAEQMRTSQRTLKQKEREVYVKDRKLRMMEREQQLQSETTAAHNVLRAFSREAGSGIGCSFSGVTDRHRHSMYASGVSTPSSMSTTSAISHMSNVTSPADPQDCMFMSPSKVFR
jgi:kinesin family member 15